MKRTRWMLFLALAPFAAACGDDSSANDAAGEDAAAEDVSGADADADAEVEEEADAAETTEDGVDDVDDVPDVSDVDDVPDVSDVDDVPDDGAMPPGDWTCLGSVTWPTPLLTTIDMTGTVQDYLTDAPIAGATVKVCARTDTDCTAPLDEGTTDALGEAVVTVPLGSTGFDGYFDIAAAGYVPALRYTVDPITSVPSAAASTAPLITTTTFAMLAGAAGITIDPARGHLILTAMDCEPAFAAGVALTVDTADSSSTRLYMVGGLPSTTATETDVSGGAGYVNLPAGAATVSTSLAATSDAVGSTDINIRAGAIAMFTMPPTP